MQTRQQGSAFLTELKQKLLLSPNEVERAGTRYNVPLINSLVLYVGMQVRPSKFLLLIPINSISYSFFENLLLFPYMFAIFYSDLSQISF